MAEIGVRATYVPATWAVHPVGVRVWLPREGRHGRVIVQAQGGLLYRVRLEGETTPRLLGLRAAPGKRRRDRLRRGAGQAGAGAGL